MEGRGRANNQTGTFGSEPHDLCELCWVEHIFLVGGGMRACMYMYLKLEWERKRNIESVSTYLKTYTEHVHVCDWCVNRPLCCLLRCHLLNGPASPPAGPAFQATFPPFYSI